MCSVTGHGPYGLFVSCAHALCYVQLVAETPLTDGPYECTTPLSSQTSSSVVKLGSRPVARRQDCNVCTVPFRVMWGGLKCTVRRCWTSAFLYLQRMASRKAVRRPVRDQGAPHFATDRCPRADPKRRASRLWSPIAISSFRPSSSPSATTGSPFQRISPGANLSAAVSPEAAFEHHVRARRQPAISQA